MRIRSALLLVATVAINIALHLLWPHLGASGPGSAGKEPAHSEQGPERAMRLSIPEALLTTRVERLRWNELSGAEALRVVNHELITRNSGRTLTGSISADPSAMPKELGITLDLWNCPLAVVLECIAEQTFSELRMEGNHVRIARFSPEWPGGQLSFVPLSPIAAERLGFAPEMSGGQIVDLLRKWGITLQSNSEIALTSRFEPDSGTLLVLGSRIEVEKARSLVRILDKVNLTLPAQGADSR